MIAHVANDVQADLRAMEQGDASVPAALAGALVDHVGVAVGDLDAACRFYASLGCAVGPVEVVRGEQVRVAMVAMGTSRIELLQALTAESSIGRFIARRGEGMHHLALSVSDVDAAFERVQEAGLRLASDCVRVGAGGHRYFFVHPASAHGVLLEIVGQRSVGTEAA